MKTALLIALVAACKGNDAAVSNDATADTPAGFGSMCDGACQTTALAADFQISRTLDVAYFGLTAADNTLHVEAYRGSAAGCPTMSSPSPDYALIVTEVVRPSSAAASSPPATMLDYVGDLLGGPLGQAAATVTLTPVAASGDTFVAFDAMLTFASGTVTGHVYATHCASLDS